MVINGFRKAKSEGKLKDVKIWVRRGGPREKEGLDAMRALKDPSKRRANKLGSTLNI